MVVDMSFGSLTQTDKKANLKNTEVNSNSNITYLTFSPYRVLLHVDWVLLAAEKQLLNVYWSELV
jgi:hypothetical protein